MPVSTLLSMTDVDGLHMWCSLCGPSPLNLIPPHPTAPTVDAKGILDLQAGAGLLAEHGGHAQHVLKGEHVVVREHSADAVSEGVDLWVGGREEVFQGQFTSP